MIKKTSSKSTMNRYFSLLFKVAATMLFSIFLFFGIGFYLDSFFSAGGIFIIIGTFMGVFIGFYCIYKIINSVLK